MSEHICPACGKIFECPAGDQCEEEYLYPDDYPLHQCQDCFGRQYDVDISTHMGYHGAFADYQNKQAKGEFELDSILKNTLKLFTSMANLDRAQERLKKTQIVFKTP